MSKHLSKMFTCDIYATQGQGEVWVASFASQLDADEFLAACIAKGDCSYCMIRNFGDKEE